MTTFYNHEFQVIDTPEKAYVLGFIYSDGYISHHGLYVTSISQHEQDEYLLDEIKELFPFFRKINDSTKPNAKILICRCKDLYNDLLNNGLFPNKSNENRFNLRLPKLPNNLLHHFIRGYFDGDGSVFKQKAGNTKIEIGGTCFYMITDLIKVLYDNGITVNLRCRYAGEAKRTLDFYVFYTSSDKISKQFADYIYRDCGNLYMKRKYEKLYFIPEYHRLERLICPNCNGCNTVRAGQRQMLHGLMYRGYCKDCDKQFSITAPVSSNIGSGTDELLED